MGTARGVHRLDAREAVDRLGDGAAIPVVERALDLRLAACDARGVGDDGGVERREHPVGEEAARRGHLAARQVERG